MHLPASEGLKATVDSIANVTAADTAIGDIAGTCPPLESMVDKAAYENNCRKRAKVLHGNTEHCVVSSMNKLSLFVAYRGTSHVHTGRGFTTVWIRVFVNP